MIKNPDTPTLARAKAIMAHRRARYFQKALEHEPLLRRPGTDDPVAVAAMIAAGKKYQSRVMG